VSKVEPSGQVARHESKLDVQISNLGDPLILKGERAEKKTVGKEHHR
jgi:hypothetical protein